MDVTLRGLLATPHRCFIEVMKRRTYHLPPNIDEALARRANTLGTTPSVIVRDALATYLAMDDEQQRMKIGLDVLHQEQHACLLLLKELLARVTPPSARVGVIPTSDRVRARFDQIMNKEEQYGNGNR
ncbi:CopG family transcriptional regulator [Dyella humi]|uniref:Ribbon-helix-helix protein, CopG family n=1 Tax=Dyella humi TaxID=1770547 RepID=A0ABW8IKX6_9GAMM